MSAARGLGKRLLGPRAVARLRGLMRGYEQPRWGNLRRTVPFSTHYGFERGTPIDRHYLHRFFETQRELIHGDVLEVQSSSYTRRFGRDLGRVDSFDIVDTCSPTYLCDLAACEDVLPTDGYDCVLLPNTLQHLRELDACLRHILRVARPGGTILASAAGFIPLTDDVADYWRLSPDGWRELLGRAWRGHEVTVTGHGNCLTAVAAMYGLPLEELDDRELDHVDSRYPVLTTILCRKASG